MTTLSQRTQLGLEIAGLGLVAGIVGDSLLRAMPWGLNVTLGTAALVGSAVWLVRRHNLKTGPDAPWLAITALLLGAAFLRRDAEDLAAYDVLALIATLAMGAASIQGELISKWHPLDYIRGLVTAAAASIVGSLVLLLNDIKWNEVPQEGRLRHARPVLLGVVIAVPLLVIFAALFASADPMFNSILSNLFSFDMESAIQHTFLIIFWAGAVAGYLRWSFLGKPVVLQAATVKPVSTIVPLATVLGLLNFLFLMFVVVQLRYFFGGASLVVETEGLTYASYARQGFFQLLAASALVLPIVLGADHLVRGGSPAQLRVFRQLGGLLLGLLAVIMASALRRMQLYVAEFGLSTDRLYATAFMVLLFGVFAWFAWTVLRGARQRFGFGALMQAFALLAGLHILNPDAFVVRTNLNRSTETRPFDAAYATRLGADAVPVLVEALPRLPIEDRCLVVKRLLDRWVDGEKAQTDWRTWNWSRSRARAVLTERAAELRASCKDVPVREAR